MIKYLSINESLEQPQFCIFFTTLVAYSLLVFVAVILATHFINWEEFTNREYRLIPSCILLSVILGTTARKYDKLQKKRQ